MTEKQFEIICGDYAHVDVPVYVISDDKLEFDIYGSKKDAEILCTLLNEIEQLKQQIQEIKTDEKQLGISFMDYKMQLNEILQQNYNYAYNQRQRNLDNSLIAKTYEVLAYTIFNIGETMNVDIERFPKGDMND